MCETYDCEGHGGVTPSEEAWDSVLSSRVADDTRVVDLSKAPRGFTYSIISSPPARTMQRIKHHAQGQDAVVLPGFTERSAPMVTQLWIGVLYRGVKLKEY